MIFEHIFEMYLVSYASVFLHEIIHVLAAKLIGLTIYGFHMGDNLLTVRFKAVSISPLVLMGGSVDFEKVELLQKSKKQIALFFLSGPCANLFLIILASIIKSGNPFIVGTLKAMNLLLLAVNISPVFVKKNDIRQLLNYISECRLETARLEHLLAGSVNLDFSPGGLYNPPTQAIVRKGQQNGEKNTDPGGS